MAIFDEYSPSDKDSVLAGDLKEWTWFKIYIFIKKKIDLEKELKSLNDLLLKHEGNNYEEFSVCLERLFLPDRAFGFYSRKKKLEVKMSFNFLVYFWNIADENGSMTWIFTDQKLSALYYFNDKILTWKKCFPY